MKRDRYYRYGLPENFNDYAWEGKKVFIRELAETYEVVDDIIDEIIDELTEEIIMQIEVAPEIHEPLVDVAEEISFELADNFPRDRKGYHFRVKF